MIINLITQHADRITQLGLHFLWQGTVIAILAAFISRFFVTTPRHRSTLYLSALAMVFFCVPVTLMNLSSPSIDPISAPVASAASMEMALPPAPTTAVGEAPQVLQKHLPLSFWIVGIYLAGLLLMMIRVIRGYLWSSKVRRNAQSIQEGPWFEALTHAVSSMRLRSAPIMIWSKHLTSPVVTGIFRPMIVLPVALMSGLPREQAIAVLSHELAHLRRFDHIAVVFQRLLEALFFFHPAVWFLSRRLDQEREKACDDLVLKSGHNRADYAEALVKIASDDGATLALAAANSSHLKERVLRILKQPQPSTVRVNGGGWLTIAVTIAALGILSLNPVHSEEDKKAEKPGRNDILQRSWAVPPTFMRSLQNKVNDDVPLSDPNDPFSVPDDPFSVPDKGGIKKRKSITVLLKENGVSFPPKSSAAYLPDNSTLIARNTSDNLDLIEAIIWSVVDPEGLRKKQDPKQVAKQKAFKEFQKIIIPKVDFKAVTLVEAVAFLRLRALELDPTKKGYNINIFGGGQDLGKAKIDALKLKNVPLSVVLEYVCKSTKTRYTLDGRNIAIIPLLGE